MQSTCEHSVAIAKYHKRVLVAGFVAYAMFIAALWAVVLLLRAHRSDLAMTIDSVKSSPFAQTVAPLAVFGLSSLPALLFLYLAVGRIRRSSDLYCDACSGELFTHDSQYFIRLLSMCPHCGDQLNGPPCTVDPGYFERWSQRHRRHFKFAMVGVCMALPVMYVILVWGKRNSAFPHFDWPMILGFPVFFAAAFLGPFYLSTRASLARLHRAKTAWHCANDIQQEDQDM